MTIEDGEFEIIEQNQGMQTVIDRLNELARKGNYVFRGYGKQDELLPNIIRKGNYADIEEKLLNDFERYGSSYFHAASAIDFMSYAQHFGLPTRLLDFTYNPYIALSFALYMSKGNNYKVKEDGEYYYVRYASLEDNLCKLDIPLSKHINTNSLAHKACQCIKSVTNLFEHNSLNQSIESINEFGDGIANEYVDQEKIQRHAILFIDPNQSNQRIIMQQGLFMFPYTLMQEEHLKIIKTNSKVIMIHKELRDELLQYLDILGYNTFRLMPDLSSICEAIKKRNVQERMENKRTQKSRGLKQ